MTVFEGPSQCLETVEIWMGENGLGFNYRKPENFDCMQNYENCALNGNYDVGLCT